jgi:hypothetical protein
MDATNMKPAATLAACWFGRRGRYASRVHLLIWAELACLVVLLLVTGGCRVLSKIPIGRNKAKEAAAEMRVKLQRDVMREADHYIARVAQATDDLTTKVGTPQVRIAATEWKLAQGTAVFVTASGENSALDAVDMVVIATLSRMIVQDYWVGKEFGEAARPLLEAHRQLETNSWNLVAEVLTPEQKRELREGIAHWRQKNPNLRNIGVARSGDFVDLVLSSTLESDGTSATTKLLSVVGLDPLSGLKPAVREIEQTRIMAERAIYYAGRMPKLLSWQAELFVYRMVNQPESKQVLSNANRLTRSAEIFAETAEKLPKLVNDQREAAINQVFDRMASEESKVRGLLGETRTTLSMGREMADSVNGAIKSLDAYTRFVSAHETNAPPDSTNHVPFDVRDYGKAAREIGSMARDINTLLIAAKQGAPQATQLSQQARADANEVLNHAFRLGLLLILFLITGLLAAGLIYRVLANRLTRDRGQKPALDS